MEILIQGELAERDMQRGVLLARGKGFRVMRVAVMVLVGLMAVFAILSVVLADAGSPSGKLQIVGTPLALVVVLGFLYWGTPWLQARQMKRAPLARGEITGVANDEAIELQSEFSYSRTRRDAFVQYRMNDEVVLLFQHASAAIVLPKGLFPSQDDCQQVREHIRRAVPRKVPRTSRWQWMFYGFLAVISIVIVVIAVQFGR